jgi:hypothetical protein
MFGIDFNKTFRGGGAKKEEEEETIADQEEQKQCDTKNEKTEEEEDEEEEERSAFGEDGDENNDIDKDSEEEQEEDIHKLLEDMEIPDFSMSDDNQDLSREENEPVAPLKDDKPAWGKVDWKKRLLREEVFSKRYKPSKDETKELNEMANHLGLAPATGIIGMGKRASMQIGMGTQVTDNMHKLFYGGHSILLKRGGPLKWKKSEDETVNVGLLLLTEGFVLTYRKFSKLNPLEKRYETCQLWTAVDYCGKVNKLTFCIQLNDGQRFELEIMEEETDDVKTRMKALERIFIEHAMHESSDVTETMGWQYQLIRTPGYSAAVMGNAEILGKPKNLNKLDKYKEYAPLHYAVQQETPDEKVIQVLLKKGADPNFPDGEGRSAMYYGTYNMTEIKIKLLLLSTHTHFHPMSIASFYYLPAERNRLTHIQRILEGKGGRASKLAEMEERGELFGSAEQAQHNTERRRERDRTVKENEQAVKDQKAAEANAKAESAQSEMGKNMSALIERGEKIEQLDEKTQKLENEAKTFGGLAKQLKEQAKNKKWYQL